MHGITNNKADTSNETANPSAFDTGDTGEANNANGLGDAVQKLSAIAHEGRLRLLRLLIQSGPEGESAGELAKATAIGATTASAQLLVLANAGLVQSRRDGRQVIYRANYSALEGLLGFLVEDCCCGRAEICAPVARRLDACCDP